MRRLIHYVTIGIMASFLALLPVAGVASAFTLNPVCSKGVNCSVVKQDTLSNGATTKKIIGQILLLAAALAVIVIIYGGIRYVISQGESSHLTAAKNTILYAVVGLIVSLLAYAIVQFVINTF